MNNSLTILSGLPAPIVSDIKRHLGAYDTAYITRGTDGQYRYTAAIILHNSQYDEQIGTVYASEVLTEDERILAYVHNFRDYPYRSGKERITYNGEKDYKRLNSNWTNVALDSERNLVFS